MILEEALKGSGIAQACYGNKNVIVVKQSEGYQLTIQQGTFLPYFVRERLPLMQIENEIRATGVIPPLEWNSVELEG